MVGSWPSGTWTEDVGFIETDDQRIEIYGEIAYELDSDLSTVTDRKATAVRIYVDDDGSKRHAIDIGFGTELDTLLSVLTSYRASLGQRGLIPEAGEQ